MGLPRRGFFSAEAVYGVVESLDDGRVKYVTHKTLIVCVSGMLTFLGFFNITYIG